jgi:hypothetical protein
MLGPTLLRGAHLPPRRVALPLALALATALAYGASGLIHTGGEWTAPLDDAYIYYQYAKMFAAGHPFAYAPGDPPTTGATSLLHLALLAPWFLVGVRGASAVAVTFVGGALALAAALWLVRDLLERRVGREAALWGTLLFATSGPLAWGFFSGMELPLVHLLFVASCHALLTGAPTRRTLLLLAGLALSRPEGLLFVLALLLAHAARAVASIASPGRAGAADASAASGSAGAAARSGAPVAAPALPPIRALLLPAAAGLLPFLLSFLLTGSLSMQSMRSKALLYEGATTSGELVARGADFFSFVVKGLFGGGVADPAGSLNANRGQVASFFAPLLFLFFLIGILPEAAEEARRRRPGFFLPAAIWFFLGLFVESALLPYSSHWNRYEMPFMPLFLLGAVLGTARAAAWLGEARGGVAFMRGAFAFFLLYSAIGWATFAVAFGWNARDIHDQHVVAGRWIAANLPPGARVALNDAGALAYFGERPVLDLIGLVSRGTTDPCNEGVGAIYEHLESLPPAARPTHFALYPDWFRLSDTGVLGTALLTAPLFRRTIAGSAMPLTIHAADWSLAGSGDAPLTIPSGWRAVDALDVADLASEARHAYRFRRPGPGLPESEARTLTYAGEGGARVADGGRLLAGGERFRAAVRAGEETYLVARADGPFLLDVRVNGARVGAWSHAGDSGVWSEADFRIPAERVTSSTLEIEIDTPAGLGQRGYRIFHYWVCQRG